MHKLHFILASAAVIASAPASAVTLTSTSAANGNTVTPFETSSSQISVDFGIAALSPVDLGFTVEANDANSYFFDSAVSVFTGTNALARGLNSLTLTLSNGATFGLGNVAAFSNAVASLNGSGNVLTVRFTPEEFVGVDLGSFTGTNGDFLINRNGLAAGDSFGLTVQAGAVPEPATWMAMALGFGLLGASLRRRRATKAFA